MLFTSASALESRTYVITGAASGIGLATKRLLERTGHKVIGIDRHSCEVNADLTLATERIRAIDTAGELARGKFDALIANAGSAAPVAATISVNFFAATEMIELSHRYLLSSPAPRVVATSSMATILPLDDDLVIQMLSGSESSALNRALALIESGGGNEQKIYPATKRALSRWIRRESIKPKWTGAGIPMNAIAPGIVRTPMVAEMIATPAGRESLAKSVPMPLHGYLEAETVAELIAWLASPTNTHVTGQLIFIDGGADVSLRGDDIW